MKASLKIVKGALMLFALLFFYSAYLLFIPCTQNKGNLRIRGNMSLQQLSDSLNVKFGLAYPGTFRFAAKLMGYSDPRPCKIRIEKEMSVFGLIRLLQKNNRQTVDIVLRSGWTPGQMARYLGSRLEPDSAMFMAAFMSKQLAAAVRFSDTLLQVFFIPDTYNFYYAAKAEEVLQRIASSGITFWKKRNITPDSAFRIYTLASIVEKESQRSDERPTIAGVYLNRLKKGMKLQADPTVNYALGEWRALLFRDLEVESPYNTYKYYGLPPGPICIPSVQSIESVLKPAVHNYLFFVARGDGSGYHRFAVSDTEHYRNIELRKKELSAPRGL